jgi:hypothetical protein
MVVNGGISEDDAGRKAAADTEQLFPADQLSAGQSVFVIEAGGEDVGELWIAERQSWRGPELWIYDIHVEDTHRVAGTERGNAARGVGSAPPRLDRVALNVFGGNEVARSLYRSLGYGENAIAMSKDLSLRDRATARGSKGRHPAGCSAPG